MSGDATTTDSPWADDWVAEWDAVMATGRRHEVECDRHPACAPGCPIYFAILEQEISRLEGDPDPPTDRS
jgi:hypothetical protein